MKVVILAGGFGTRISEESHLRPKPMIEIGGKPILWHIMKIYSYYGFHDFIICLGYKSYSIKEYFANYYLFESDVTFHLGRQSETVIHNYSAEPWSVTLVETGLDTMTGGRIKMVRKYVGEETFMMTYGDGVSDIDLARLVNMHRSHGKLATVTATQPQGRFGMLNLAEDDTVVGFQEKPKGDGGWINAGFFVLEPGIFDYIEDKQTSFEKEPLERLARNGQLAAYKHTGFWHPMDTMRDKKYLETIWESGKAAWKKW